MATKTVEERALELAQQDRATNIDTIDRTVFYRNGQYGLERGVYNIIEDRMFWRRSQYEYVPEWTERI